MNLLRGLGDFFAMDIGTNVIRLVQLDGNYDNGWTLQKYAYVPVPTEIMQDSSSQGQRKLGDLIKSSVEQAGITTKNIAIGMPSKKAYNTIITLPNMPINEIEQTIKYQAEEYIPMSPDSAKVDFALLGSKPGDPNQLEVLLSATDKKYAEDMMEQVEALGLNVIAQEPDPIALSRALLPANFATAQMIIDLGERSCDLVISYNGSPRLIRSIPVGISTFVKILATTLAIKESQSRQFILKFGLAQDKLEGQVFKILDLPLTSFATELQKSIRFFQTKYPDIKVSGIALSGFAGIIPFVPEYIEAKLNIPTFQGNPWQMVRVSNSQKQALINVASEFAVAIGLAERSN